MSQFNLSFSKEAVQDLICTYLDENVFSTRVNSVAVATLNVQIASDGSMRVSGDFEGQG